jgi:Flp pilus assembly pilin Flp
MRRANAMWLIGKKKKRHYKGQNLIEYATIAAIVAAAAVAMSTYVFRSVQATQQAIQKEFQKSE